MSGLDYRSGDKIAEAIDRRIVAVAKQVYETSPNNKTKYGRVISKKDGLFTVEIEKSVYPNVKALRNVGDIGIGEVVVCMVPNNQFSNIMVLGVADGTIDNGSGGGDSPSINVVDNVSSDSSTDALSANQGRVLNEKISDANKNINDIASKLVSKTSELTNDGDGTSPFATEDFVAQKGGKIDSISVNGVAQTIDENKNVDLNVPTKVSELENDSKFIDKNVDDLKNYTTTNDMNSLLDDKANKSEIPDVSSFITKAVSDLVNYYTKSETYTQAQVNALVSAIPKFSIQVVEILPTSDISTTTIYLLKTSDTETANLYTEYIYLSTGWEKLGTQTLDLSGYLTIEAFNTSIADYYNKTSIDSLLNKKQNVINSENLLSALYVDTSNTLNRQFVTSAEKEAWNEKQDKIDSLNMLSSNFIADNESKRFVTDVEKEQWNLAEKNVQSDWSVTDDNSDAFIKNKPNLSTVATSGSYNDLYDKPSIPTVDYPVTSVNGKTKDVQLVATDVKALPDTTLYGATLYGEQNVAGNSISIVLKDQNGQTLKSLTFKVPYSTSALINDSDFTTNAYVDGIKSEIDNAGYITKSVTDLINYYNKDNSYSKTQVNELIGSIERITMQIVAKLPDIGESNVIYLVPSKNGSQDNYDEYVYTSTLGWEKIGHTDIDLSDYPKTEQMNTAIANATANLVPNTRKVNGKELSSDITLNASDVGALSSSTIIPTVNNGKLTIQKNGADIGSFTANQSGDTSVNIVVPTTANDVGAEPAFSKNTAFNKNFGQTAGTVCEGNDSRLSNDRKNPNALTITQNGQTTTYDGSSAVNIEIEKPTIDLPDNVVLTDGDAQTITKDLTIETRNPLTGNTSITFGNSEDSIVNNPYVLVRTQRGTSTFKLRFPYESGTLALLENIPSSYLKNAVVSDDTLTITKQDDTIVSFKGGGGVTLRRWTD